MAIFKGLGDCGLATTDLAGGPSAQKLYPFPAFTFDYSAESETADVREYRGGIRVKAESIEQDFTPTLTLTTQISNWHQMGLALNQLKKSVTNFTLPRIVRGVVPTGGVITDAQIVAGNLASVLVAIERYGSWGQAGALNRSSTAPGPMAVQVAAGTLTFNAAQAGAPIMYMVDQTLASADVYGGPGATAYLAEMEFYGDIYDSSAVGAEGGKIWFPRIKRTNRNVQIGFSGDLIELSTEWDCLYPSNWSEPYALVDGHSIS